MTKQNISSPSVVSNDNIRRAAARLAAVQALYQMEKSGVGVDTVVLEFKTYRLGGEIDDVAIHDADDKFFEDITRGVVAQQKRLDPYIHRRLASGWTLPRIDATARAILRAGLYELTQRPDVPMRVVLDEYIELAKSFFDQTEVSFINGLLDAAAQDLRADEDV